MRTGYCNQCEKYSSQDVAAANTITAAIFNHQLAPSLTKISCCAVFESPHERLNAAHRRGDRARPHALSLSWRHAACCKLEGTNRVSFFSNNRRAEFDAGICNLAEGRS